MRPRRPKWTRAALNAAILAVLDARLDGARTRAERRNLALAHRILAAERVKLRRGMPW